GGNRQCHVAGVRGDDATLGPDQRARTAHASIVGTVPAVLAVGAGPALQNATPPETHQRGGAFGVVQARLPTAARVPRFRPAQRQLAVLKLDPFRASASDAELLCDAVAIRRALVATFQVDAAY